MDDIISCVNCFYSQDSCAGADTYGRRDGVEAFNGEITTEHCICYEGPKPLLIAEQIVGGEIPDIRREPSYHKCGRGRWWRDGEWMKWINLEIND